MTGPPNCSTPALAHATSTAHGRPHHADAPVLRFDLNTSDATGTDAHHARRLPRCQSFFKNTRCLQKGFLSGRDTLAASTIIISFFSFAAARYFFFFYDTL
jgi:hypothetical protein